MFLKFLLLILAGYLAADVYINVRYLRGWWAVAMWLLFAVMASGVVVFFVMGRLAQLREAFIFVFLAAAIPQVIFAVVSLPGLLVWRRLFTFLGLAAGLFALFIIVYGGTMGPRHFVVREVEIASSDLPAEFDGYRIAQITDIHLAGWGARKEEAMARVVSLVNAQRADAIFVTGDLVHHRAAELDGVEDILAGLHAPDGVWSVLGNHDYGPYWNFGSTAARDENLRDLKRRQAAMGWRLLLNEHVFLERNGAQIALVGVENAGEGHFADYSDLARALPSDVSFKILLSHDPTIWRREVVGFTGVDLTLSGHTHAGQFRLGRLSFARLTYREWGGLYFDGAQALYVNPGIGQTGLVFRFGAWPEVTIITLRKL